MTKVGGARVDNTSDEKIGHELSKVINCLPTLESTTLTFPWGGVEIQTACSCCFEAKDPSEVRIDLATRELSSSATLYTLCAKCSATSISEWRFSADQILFKSQAGWKQFPSSQILRPNRLKRVALKFGLSL